MLACLPARPPKHALPSFSLLLTPHCATIPPFQEGFSAPRQPVASALRLLLAGGSLREGFEWGLHAYTLSTHFVSHTLSPHLVPTPCLHTLSSHRTQRSGATRKTRRSRAAVSGALSRPCPRPRPRPRPRARYCRYCRSCRDCRWLPPHIHYPAILVTEAGNRCGVALGWYIAPLQGCHQALPSLNACQNNHDANDHGA